MERKVKNFLIEVEEGDTQCENCPLDGCKCKLIDGLDCDMLNLATMKIKEYDDGKEAACIEDGFEFGVAYMLGRVEDWLRKIGRGQLIGSLNRFLKERVKE